MSIPKPQKTQRTLPPKGHAAEELLQLMTDPAHKARTLSCAACGAQSALVEVALRPKGWLRPAALRDDITMQTSTVPSWTVFRGVGDEA